MNSGIYKITNKFNNKKYIGQSINVTDRKNTHFQALRRGDHSNSHLQNAFNKYGESQFSFEIIEHCPVEHLDEREIYFIDKYNSTNRHLGYNIESGGNSNPMADETKSKIQESNRGKNNTLTEDDVVNILEMRLKDYSLEDIGNIYGVHTSSIGKITTGINWNWVRPDLVYMISKMDEFKEESIRVLTDKYYSRREICELFNVSNGKIISIVGYKTLGKDKLEDALQMHNQGYDRLTIMNELNLCETYVKQAISKYEKDKKKYEIQEMRDLRSSGMKVKNIAEKFGVHRTTVSKYTKDIVPTSC